MGLFYLFATAAFSVEATVLLRLSVGSACVFMLFVNFTNTS